MVQSRFSCSLLMGWESSWGSGLGLGIPSSQIFTLRIVIVILLLVTVVAVIVGVVDREENAKHPQPLNPTA